MERGETRVKWRGRLCEDQWGCTVYVYVYVCVCECESVCGVAVRRDRRTVGEAFGVSGWLFVLCGSRSSP